MSDAGGNGGKPLNQFLRMAVVAGVESAVRLHIERGDDLNARDASGMTPLMLSAVRNKPVICQLLLRAGADHSLVDPTGRTALQIAIAGGSQAAVAILETVTPPVPGLADQVADKDSEPDPTFAPPRRTGSICDPAMPDEPATVAPYVVREASVEPAARPTAPPLPDAPSEPDQDEFDLSGWEAEEAPTRPEVDRAIVESASAVQIAITAHEPIDTSAEWSDIDAFLPEAALPLARADDAEGRATLRRLLLRALREGSVPALDVQAQSTNEDRSANLEAEAYLAMIINDLGAEVDERFEYSVAGERFEVFIDPDEDPDEEAALDEALVAIDRAASPRDEPLRIYQREFQRLRLLSADEEVELGKAMEAALEAALDALASWPEGIARTLVAGNEALAGVRQLSSIWSGGEPDPAPASPDSPEVQEPAQAEADDSTDVDEEPPAEPSPDAGSPAFANALRQLAALVECGAGVSAPVQEVRRALSELHLNRRFLLELIDAANGCTPCPGFLMAMVDFRKARDRMTAANLKLAFFLARKYQYSGEPLDDLAQEANIGLLRAVDRFDWRRGFRFSTYATWWIRQQIGRHIADKVRTIRVPVHVHERLQRAERAARAFEESFGREPTLDELAHRLELPQSTVSALLRIAPGTTPIDDLAVDGMVAVESREDYLPPDPADVVDVIQRNRAVDQYIASLSTKTRKEEHILRLRFGIGVPEALTLDEIGQRFEVTRERIRQIEVKAVRKLRHPVRLEHFSRVVLGEIRDSDIVAPDVPGYGGDGGSHHAQEVSRPSSKDRAANGRQPPQPSQRGGASKLDQILAQAAEIGIPVGDDRPASGRIWVELTEVREKRHRRLVRRLLELGFEYWPGKGYWK